MPVGQFILGVAVLSRASALQVKPEEGSDQRGQSFQAAGTEDLGADHDVLADVVQCEVGGNGYADLSDAEGNGDFASHKTKMSEVLKHIYPRRLSDNFEAKIKSLSDRRKTVSVGPPVACNISLLKNSIRCKSSRKHTVLDTIDSSFDANVSKDFSYSYGNQSHVRVREEILGNGTMGTTDLSLGNRKMTRKDLIRLVEEEVEKQGQQNVICVVGKYYKEIIDGILNSDEWLVQMTVRLNPHPFYVLEIGRASTSLGKFSMRLHIYNSRFDRYFVQPPLGNDEGIHSHKWSFGSQVLVGKLTHQILHNNVLDAGTPVVRKDDQFEMWSAYRPNEKELRKNILERVVSPGSEGEESVPVIASFDRRTEFQVERGDSYWINRRLPHTVVNPTEKYHATLVVTQTDGPAKRAVTPVDSSANMSLTMIENKLQEGIVFTKSTDLESMLAVAEVNAQGQKPLDKNFRKALLRELVQELFIAEQSHP